MGKIAVSACLIGKNTKYNGGNNYNEAVMSYLQDKDYILICPEVMGGLPTPRNPSEIKNNKVISNQGTDVTSYFKEGADKAFQLLKFNDVTEIILKANSPSCGYLKVYNGEFNGTLVDGNGIFTSKLINENITIYTEKDIENIMKSKV